MEAFALYLFKSSVWLTGFAAVYFLFLRNERFFLLNRILLIAGIMGSVVFPFFTWHYTVVFPIIPTVNIDEPQVQAIGVVKESFQTKDLLLYIYILGALYLIYRLIKQTTSVWQLIRRSETLHFNSVKLIRTDRYPASFSFFSFVFVNPSTHEHEVSEIVNHEQEHIRQRHWIDLLLFEILCTIQWFNPVVWIYGRFIRQNHEFLADEYAIKRSPNPAIYRAALLNQMFGGPVISLANSFNYSINKKRFNMMKQMTYSPFRKLKLLLVLPLIAGVFYAFAAPEYKFVQAEGINEVSNLPQNLKTVKGKVIKEDGTPLRGTSIVVKQGTSGTLSGENGVFELKVENDMPLVFSFVGFESQEVKPDFEKEMVVTLKRQIFFIDAVGNKPSASEIVRIPGPVPILTFVDGKETSEEDLKKIKPDQIESVVVIKNKEFTAKYGEKGKNGVVLITLKKSPTVEFTAKETEQKDGDIILKEPQSLNIKSKDGKQPLLFINGIIEENKKIEDIDPKTIQSMSVWKDEKAIEKYGEKGRNGVVEITTKKGNSTEVKVTGYAKEQMDKFPTSPIEGKRNEWNNISGYYFKEKPLIVKDGVVSPELKMNDINPYTIESINVLKDEMAITKYGAKGQNGVVEVTTKKGFSAIKSKPLIVIDKVIAENQNMDNIDPESIESITVLKDQSATILYGEKGKNGVVLITSKKAAQNKNSEIEVVGYAANQKSEENKNSAVTIRSTGTAKNPLIVVDGVISAKKIEDIKPETIESVNVWTNEKAIKKYGDNGKDGVVEITLKKEKEVFVVVEELPEYPGGVLALRAFVASTMKYPTVALENGIIGQVTVGFTVAEDGSVTEAKVVSGVDPALDQEALRIVSSMPKWTPGKQRGMPVKVSYVLPINFSYPSDFKTKSQEKLKEIKNK